MGAGAQARQASRTLPMYQTSPAPASDAPSSRSPIASPIPVKVRAAGPVTTRRAPIASTPGRRETLGGARAAAGSGDERAEPAGHAEHHQARRADQHRELRAGAQHVGPGVRNDRVQAQAQEVLQDEAGEDGAGEDEQAVSQHAHHRPPDRRKSDSIWS
jgi:hypothetical protein